MKKKIDYDNWSKDELVKEIKRIKETTYGLVWHRDLPEEKIDILINPDARTPSEMFPNEMEGKPFPVLKEVKTKGIETDKNKPTNILIEGDNYHSLAVLNFTHENAIDLIYIDPPYNTGNNDFIYNDLQARPVQRDDPFRHSKWLAFMEKRLKLAKNLLKKDGVIFISIDDNEQAPLKMLCDEIFGDGNFIAQLVWKKKYTGGKNAGQYVDMHEYVLVYAKNRSEIGDVLIDRPDKEKGKFTEVDKYVKTRGKYYIRPLKSNLAERKNLVYPIKTPDGKELVTQWLVGRNTFEDLVKEERVEFRKKRNGDYQIYKKYYENDGEGKIKVPSLILEFPNTEAKAELKELFNIEEGRDNVFYTVKPVNLIKYLLKPLAVENATILDFFAGSGTTGQAVLELNKEDNGQRNFILCTNDEELDNNGNSIKHKICTDICYPRIKKVIKGYKNLKGENITGLGSNLKYYTCDFVEAGSSDRNKRKLVNESTEMLCIKEGAFEIVQEADDFKIFRNYDKYLGIIFHEDSISDYKKAIKNIKGHFNTYTFSMTDDPHKEEFADVADKVTLCAIPEVILKVYRVIFKE